MTIWWKHDFQGRLLRFDDETDETTVLDANGQTQQRRYPRSKEARSRRRQNYRARRAERRETLNMQEVHQ